MPTFRTAAIMGTGTMGPGMGAVLARAGYQVALYDTSTEALERAKAGYDLAWGVLDRLETPVVEGGSVRYASDLADALAGVELVVEAIPEDVASYRDAILRLVDDEAFYEAKHQACTHLKQQFFDAERSWGAAFRRILSRLGAAPAN